jgi:hypothetical protein
MPDAGLAGVFCWIAAESGAATTTVRRAYVLVVSFAKPSSSTSKEVPMNTDMGMQREDRPKVKTVYRDGGGGAVYGLGLIGSAVYFIQHADSFLMGVLGILKAIVWPALVMYKALEFLQF